MERTSRLPVFTDLGPPDLCNIHKQLASLKRPEFGTFLYFTGVDTLNLASIAAHLQGLANLMTLKAQYWFGEKKHFKVPELTYCSYNAFSQVDMRVTVHIPGKFECVIVSKDGKFLDKLSAEEMERMWLETFVCGVVRSVLDSEDEENNKVGLLVEIRRENLFKNSELVKSFISAFETLFWEGPKLGCGVELPNPSVVANYLVDGFLRVVQLTQMWEPALAALRRLEQEDPSVAVLIAQVLFYKDEEISAVQVLSQGIARNKRDGELLLLQAQFLMDKRRYDLALHLAKQAVNLLPLDFKMWAALVKVYTRLGDYENALLTLNLCPMNLHKDVFSLKRVVPIRNAADELHLPLPVDVTLDDVLNLLSGAIVAEQKALDPQLASLPAGSLKSTFALAYGLLTEIVNKTGWEALLKHRAKVFVMEEEYRKDRLALHTRTASEVTVDASLTVGVKLPTLAAEDSEFRKKRLCERWLDNLFMLLYEDLRAYTMWQAEFVHLQAQQMEYKKSTLEWEILGSVAFRLKHYKEGSVAFSHALAGRFSLKAQREMLRYYEKERAKVVARMQNDPAAAQYTRTVNQLNERILEATVKLLVWNHRWYNDFLPALTTILLDLVLKEGLVKLLLLVTALYSDSIGEDPACRGIIDMMGEFYAFCEQYHVLGSDN